MTEVNFEEFEPQIIKTQDENGEEHNFELIDVVTVDGNDYGLLLYIDETKEESESESEDDEEEEEVVVMKLNKEGDSFTFESIESDEEFNKVLEAINSECDCDDECDGDCDCGCHE